MVAARLAATLAALAPALPVLRGDWWLIGSAAMALLGVDDLEVADVDLLASPEDAAALLNALGVAGTPGAPSERFRSEMFGRWMGAPLPVEVMGGLHVRHGDSELRLVPRTRVSFGVDRTDLFTPSIAEMIEICRLFGRGKDLERAAKLKAML